MHIGRKGATRLFAVTASALLAACGGVETGTGPSEKLPDTPIFYVDANNGADTNHGRTQAAAFKTLNRAAGAVQPGWTVQVMNGTYTSNGTDNPLTISISGTPDAWITFTAAPGHHPVIQIPRGPGAWTGIHLFGVAYVIVDGFEVIGQRGSISDAEAATNDGTRATWNHNCHLVDGNGIIVDDSKHTQRALGTRDVQGVPYTGRTYIANNVVHDNGGRGIHLYRSEHVDVVNNTSWNDMLSSSEYILSGQIDAEKCADVNVVNNVVVNLAGKEVTFHDGNHYDNNLWDGTKVPFKWNQDIAGQSRLTD